MAPTYGAFKIRLRDLTPEQQERARRLMLDGGIGEEEAIRRVTAAPTSDLAPTSPDAKPIATEEDESPFSGLEPPDQKLGKADYAMKIMEVLGGLGGGIMADRAQGKANKQMARRQAYANLINTLAKKPSAEVAPVDPKLGTGGRILQALGSIGKAGGELRGQGREMEQTDFQNQLGLAKAEQQAGHQDAMLAAKDTPEEEGVVTDLGLAEDIGYTAAFEEGGVEGIEDRIKSAFPDISGAELIRHREAAQRGLREGLEDKATGTRADTPTLTPNQIVDLAQDIGYTAAFKEGGAEGLEERLLAAFPDAEGADIVRLKEAAQRGLREGEADIKTGNRQDDRIQNAKDGLQLERDRFDRDKKQAILKSWDREMEIMADDISNQVRLASQSRDKRIPGFTEMYSEMFKEIVETMGQHEFASLSPEERDRHLKIVNNAYNDELISINKELAKQGGMSHVARMARMKAEMQLAKIHIYRERYNGLWLKGPALGRLPALQAVEWIGIEAESAAYDHMIKGYQLDLASDLNQGRPSDRDFDMAALAVPERGDAAGVARIKWDTLQQVMTMKIKAIDNNWPGSVLYYVNSDGSYNRDAANSAIESGNIEDPDLLQEVMDRANQGDLWSQRWLDEKEIKWRSDTTPPDPQQQGNNKEMPVF